MGFIKRFIERRQRQTTDDRLIHRGPGFIRPTAGVYVNEDVALTYSAIWSAVRIISETLASLSWHEFRRLSDGGRERQVGSDIDFLVHEQANPEMTSNTFRETLQSHALTWGNGYAEIERDRAGRPLALWPLPPDRVRPLRDVDGSIIYEVRGTNGATVVLPMRDMFHVKGLGFDGLVGYSPITMARETVAMGLAAERFGSAFYGNDSRPGGILKHPAQLKDQQRKDLREEFERIHRGASNSWRVAVFENGLDFQPIGIPQNDAQYIETRKFQITEVARWYRIPPHKMADLERATFSNIEQQSIEFVTDAIVPWVNKWECEANWKLYGRNSRTNKFTRMKVESILRGDIKSRYEAYAVGRNWGWLSADDVRELEDLNRLPSDQNGDLYLIPANMVPAEQALDEPDPAPVPSQFPPSDDTDGDAEPGTDDDAAGNDQLVPSRSLAEFRETYSRIFSDILRRSLGREKARVDQTPDKVKAFYVEHRVYLERALAAAAQSLGDLIGTGPASVRAAAITAAVSQFAQDYATRSVITVIDATTCGDLAGLMELWELDKPDTHAEQLTEQLINAARSTTA